MSRQPLSGEFPAKGRRPEAHATRELTCDGVVGFAVRTSGGQPRVVSANRFLIRRRRTALITTPLRGAAHEKCGPAGRVPAALP